MNRWFTRARRHFTQPDSELKTDAISSDNLSQLVRQWIRNGGIEKGYRNMEKAIEERLHLFRCNCREAHTCSLINCYTFPQGLLSILIHDLALEVEGMADALHFSELFGEWWSIDNIDQHFGRKLIFSNNLAKGRNIFLHPSFNSISGKKIANCAIEKIKKDLILEAPLEFSW